MVIVEPQMYREALAGLLHRRRPEVEVLVVAPGELRGGPAEFRPDLLLHNDTDEASAEVFGDVARIEVLYKDSLNARIVVGGRVRESRDMDVDGMLGVVDEVERLVSARGGADPSGLSQGS